MNKYEMEYQRLKQEADNAQNMYQITQSAMDWEYFMQCEHRVADYAFKHEKEIWDECGDHSIPNE